VSRYFSGKKLIAGRAVTPAGIQLPGARAYNFLRDRRKSDRHLSLLRIPARHTPSVSAKTRRTKAQPPRPWRQSLRLILLGGTSRNEREYGRCLFVSLHDVKSLILLVGRLISSSDVAGADVGAPDHAGTISKPASSSR
jgi:hypothetical protein